MAQFDVYRLDDGPLVLDLQTDLIGLESTRIVAPLLREGRYAAFPNLTPIVAFEGEQWIVRVQQLAALPARELRQKVGSLHQMQDALFRAIDVLTHGF